MSNIISLLSEKIKSHQCVLFLGPGVFREQPVSGETIYEEFAMEYAKEIREYNAKKAEKDKFSFDQTQQGNIYYTIPRYLRYYNADSDVEKANIGDARKKFIEYATPKIAGNQLFRMLAELPFSIIINTNPDKTIYDRIVDANRTAYFSYYDISNNSTEALRRIPTLSKENFREDATVIYNLFGSYKDEKNSLILTEEELVNYTMGINQDDKKIPKALTNELDISKNYVFLGFQFDQWILKILLKALGLPKKGDRDRKITYTINAGVTQTYLQHYYEDDFFFHFVDESSIEGFLDKVKNAYLGPVNKPVLQTRRTIVFLHNVKNERDRELTYELFNNHLKPIIDSNMVHFWDERKLEDEAGTDQEQGVREKLRDADVVIIMVSGNFMGEYQDRLEWLSNVLEQRQVKPQVVPVLLRDYSYAKIPSLTAYQWLPVENGRVKAVTQWNDRDQVLRLIAEDIQKRIDQPA